MEAAERISPIIAVIAFTGHRDWFADPRRLRELNDEFPWDLWITGGADRGFDWQVEGWAEKNEHPCLPALRPLYGSGLYEDRVAPLVRNPFLVTLCAGRFLVACWDGRETGGTYATIQHARAVGREVRILEPFHRAP